MFYSGSDHNDGFFNWKRVAFRAFSPIVLTKTVSWVEFFENAPFWKCSVLKNAPFLVGIGEKGSFENGAENWESYSVPSFSVFGGFGVHGSPKRIEFFFLMKTREGGRVKAKGGNASVVEIVYKIGLVWRQPLLFTRQLGIF